MTSTVSQEGPLMRLHIHPSVLALTAAIATVLSGNFLDTADHLDRNTTGLRHAPLSANRHDCETFADNTTDYQRLPIYKRWSK